MMNRAGSMTVRYKNCYRAVGKRDWSRPLANGNLDWPTEMYVTEAGCSYAE
jgi:hypothetical protein